MVRLIGDIQVHTFKTCNRKIASGKRKKKTMSSINSILARCHSKIFYPFSLTVRPTEAERKKYRQNKNINIVSYCYCYYYVVCTYVLEKFVQQNYCTSLTTAR